MTKHTSRVHAQIFVPALSVLMSLLPLLSCSIRGDSGNRQNPRLEKWAGSRDIRKIDLSFTKVTDETPLQRLQIHIQFTVDNLTDEKVIVQAYFFYQDGRILKDADSKSEKRYGTVDGQVSIGTQVKATSNEATLFIPISQLHLPRGKHALEIFAVVRSIDGKELVRSMKSFEYTRHPRLEKWAGSGDSDNRQNPRDETQKGTQIRKIDLSFTKVTDETPLQRLQIHIQFSVDNLTDEKVIVQAYFFYQDGRILKDADSESEKRYGTVNGQVSIGDQVKAAANETTLFIPISQLHLPRGEHALEIVAVVRSIAGEELVRSMKSFELTRR